MRRLGFNVELPEAPMCCGMPFEVAGLMDREGLGRLAALSVELSSREGGLVTPCNGCYRALNMALGGRIPVLHVAELIWRSRDRLRELVGDALRGVKVAVHVGCHYAYAVKGAAREASEGADLLEDIASSMGAEVVDYEERRLCCGATAMKWSWVVEALSPVTRLKVESMVSSGADVALVMCTACQLALDKAQYQMASVGELDNPIPVLHVAELVGLALGLRPVEDVGLHLHLVRPRAMEGASLTELLAGPARPGA